MNAEQSEKETGIGKLLRQGWGVGFRYDYLWKCYRCTATRGSKGFEAVGRSYQEVIENLTQSLEKHFSESNQNQSDPS